MHFHPERDKIWKKTYKIDGGLIAYCLIFCESKYTTKHRKMYVFLETGVKNRHMYHLLSAFGTSKSVLQKQNVLLRAEVTSHLCTKKAKKKHKFDNDLTALVLTLANSKIHQNKEKCMHSLKQV